MNTEQEPKNILKGVSTAVEHGGKTIIVSADNTTVLRGFLDANGYANTPTARYSLVHIGPEAEIAPIRAKNARAYAATLNRLDHDDIVATVKVDCPEGLVVVIGGTDDFVQLHGAITDETDERIIYLTTSGKILDAESYRSLTSLVADGTITEFPIIYEILVGEGNPHWAFVTAIPHAEFEVTHAGKPFGKGLVFEITDLKP
jgi:hypothetical protein